MRLTIIAALAALVYADAEADRKAALDAAWTDCLAWRTITSTDKVRANEWLPNGSDDRGLP